MKTIAIIGNGLSGRLAAIYFKQHLPDVDITMIDPNAPNKPIVGESTIEMTAQFLNSLGLGEYLEENHLHKYGLTYYFKIPEEKAAAAGKEYVQHEAPGVIRLPAFNLNRHTFDEELRRRVEPMVNLVEGKVTEVGFSDMGKQMIEVIDKAGETQTIAADYVVDCSGRARLLAKQLGIATDAPFQRSSYWFRLADFDRSILNGIETEKPRHLCYPSYCGTHHFYGKGYWCWLIPMKSKEEPNLASVGIVYRPDISGEKAMNMDRLLEKLDMDHPKLAAVIRSGRKVDESRYFNYMYEAKRYYDPMGRWFLLGDSGFTFDPAGSLGIAYLGHQIPQITSIIKKSQAGTLTPDYVEAMEGHIQAELFKQDQLSNRYTVMDDPVRLAWSLVFNYMAYFHIFLPDYMTGAFLNGGVAKSTAMRLARMDAMKLPKPYAFPEILDKFDDRVCPIKATAAAAHFDKAIPFSFFRGDKLKRGRVTSAFLYKRALMRNTAMKLLKWWEKPNLYPFAAGQYLRSLGDWALALLLLVRPQLYDRPASKDPAMKSAFEPAHSFLFPAAAKPAMADKKMAEMDKEPMGAPVAAE